MFDDLSYEELQRRANTPLPPRLVARIEPHGERRTVRAGEVLYRSDDRDYPFIHSVSASLRICDPTGMVLGVMSPGQFTGDLAMLLGQTAFADCIVEAPGEVVIVPQAAIVELAQVDPEIGGILLEAFAARRLIEVQRRQGTLIIIGSLHAASVRDTIAYAERNRIPYRWIDPDDPQQRAEIPPIAAGAEGVRVVVRGRHVLSEPSVSDVARALGLAMAVDPEQTADLIIVGAGPAGLSAAVYGASEGLRTVLLDDVAIGGQAAASSRIENFLGFPTGLAGADLAFRAELQAVKFGAKVATPRHAEKLEHNAGSGHYEVTLDDGARLRGRAVVIASGARYRKLGVEGEDRFQGEGLYYAATQLEARTCKDKEVVVVGGGNSAGQAAMFLASRAGCVRLVCRGRDLADSMSNYLVERLRHADNVKIEMRSQIVELIGDERLTSVKIRDGDGVVTERPACGVFVMIGADPCTDWLSGIVNLDARGFVLTGQACGEAAPQPFNIFQTSAPGVFAVGDVRAGSVKRVASAVGEGSVVVQAIHARLAALHEAETRRAVTI
jgi:thioredoxin reductase (NADPH)